MFDPETFPKLAALFNILGKPNNLALLLCLSTRKYTLAGLCRKTGRSKSLACMYLGPLHEAGLVGKDEENGKMRYWLETKELKPVLRKARKFVETFDGIDAL
jgi:DNA-binding IclR family transcriptional regulator